jgi:peptidyl-prolyl cis-trans isomerase SurA
MKQISFCFLFLILLPLTAVSQDGVLLTIDNQPVLKSEFERIYHKNSNVQGYDNKPVAEYLEMFINFKLKVLEAEKLGYDTLSSFINELAGYKDQLSKPYLQDRKLIDKLVQEAYYRTLNEVNASHIMVKLPSNATPADTLVAYTRVLEIRKRLLAGESFEKIAREESDDPSSKVNEGRLGWFSAFAMVYPFENAAYNTKVDEFSLPVRSKYGYHILHINGKRPALGEIKLAHILIRSSLNDSQESITRAKEKIDECYKLLQNGSSFTDMVKQYSEDAGSSRNGGQMRWLRSGELPVKIEDMVFALADSGSYTSPVRSDYGWHIFQLQGKRPIASFDQIKSQIEERIMMDERGKHTEEAFTANVKKECGFVEYPENVSFIAGIMDSTLYSGNWNPATAGDLIEPVFTINNREYSQKELAYHIVKTKRYSKKESYAEIVNTKCDELVHIKLLEYERGQLEEKYPAFKYLMEEYHDGILLFNIMDNNVWSKAVSDTMGLRAFYEQHANDYTWKERADVSIYTVKNPAYLKMTMKLGKKRAQEKWSSNEFIKMVCSNDSINCLEVTDQKFERGEPVPPGGFAWKKGFTTTAQEGNTTRVIIVNALIPAMPKAFNEIQGQVTADYQNYLDKQWIDTLRAKYPVVINPDVLQQVK